jgi:glucokinase
MPTCRIAVDIGATNLRVAAFTGERGMGKPLEGCTPRGGGAEAVVDAVVGKIHKIAPDPASISGICVGVPAPVDPRTGYVREVSNLPEIAGAHLLSLLSERLTAPLFVRNDAALATLGEHRRGAGEGVQDMVYVTISTGIGGGLIAGGRLVTGSRGYAGEVGELLVPSRSGKAAAPVSIETVASGAAIAAAARRALEKGEKSLLRKFPSIAAREVCEAAKVGDPVAKRIIENAMQAVAFGIVDVIHLLNPERVVLGGGLMKSHKLVLSLIEETVRNLAMKSSLHEKMIVRGKLGDKAGLHGADAFLVEMATKGALT